MDLNADLGEGFGIWRLGDDEALLGLITSANVACGFHAGDATTMRRVCGWAAAAGVAVGGQVGYRDLAGFGRRLIEYDASELSDEIIYQLAALDGFCRLNGDRVRYVKPHGALYHAAARDPRQAGAVVSAIVDYDSSLPVLCQQSSVLAAVAASHGLRVVNEAFADRAYQADGTLTPRGLPGAILSDVDSVVERAVRMAVAGEIEAVDGTILTAAVRSICLHGDTPGSVALARAVRHGLLSAGVTLTPFTTRPVRP